jgi:hypothetical protein
MSFAAHQDFARLLLRHPWQCHFSAHPQGKPKKISNNKKTWSLQRKKGRSSKKRSKDGVGEEREQQQQQQTWLQDGAAVAQWAATRIPKRAPASAPASERTQAAAVVAATAMVFPNSLKPAAAAGSILLMARALLLA